MLNDGDLLYLPTLSKETNRVYVFGEVQKPGAYTFSGSEMRLIDAISDAGGTTPFAYRADTRVVRGDITRPEILSANLARLVESGDRSQNLLLASGDLVYVPRSSIGDIKLFYDQVRPLLELSVARAGRHRLEQRGQHHRREVRNDRMAQYNINLRDYWRIIRKRKASILAMVLLVSLCSYGFAKLREPSRYTRRARPSRSTGSPIWPQSSPGATGNSRRTWKPTRTSSPATRC